MPIVTCTGLILWGKKASTKPFSQNYFKYTNSQMLSNVTTTPLTLS
jgi:hypothetical protein